MRLVAVSATVLFATAAPPAGAERRAVRAEWVGSVARHVEAGNRFARADGQPERNEVVPTSWRTVAAKYRTPRVQRQLRAIARMDLSVDALGAVVGRDEARQVVRRIRAHGGGAAIETEWRGGQGNGGQSWVVDSMVDDVEEATLQHFFRRGQRAAKRTGETAGEPTKRNVRRSSDDAYLADVTREQMDRRAIDVARGEYSPYVARLRLMRDAQRNRAARDAK